MAASTTASNLAGVWFGELASALQGTWQQAVAASSHGGGDHQPQQKLGAGHHRQSQMKKAAHQVAGAAGSKKAAMEMEEDVGRCCGAMSDTTVYLLLDRFAPS